MKDGVFSIMKRLENETQEEFEKRKSKRIVKFVVGFYVVTMLSGYIGAAAYYVINHETKYVRYAPADTELEDEEIKKTL